MPSPNHLPPEGFVRLKDIIGPTGPIPIGRSSWYAGIKAGRFPKPTKLGPRTAAWRVDVIRELIQKLGPPDNVRLAIDNVSISLASQPVQHSSQQTRRSLGATVARRHYRDRLAKGHEKSFDNPRNHRLLAAESALEHLYGEGGLMGVTAKQRDEAVKSYLVSNNMSPVSRDTIQRAMRRRRERGGADE